MIVKVILAAIMFLSISSVIYSATKPEISDPECYKIAKAYEIIAIQRDGGVTFKSLYDRFSAMREDGQITADEFSVIADMLVFVYSSDKPPLVLFQAAKRACLQSKGKVEA
jgi:hypothetical protein